MSDEFEDLYQKKGSSYIKNSLFLYIQSDMIKKTLIKYMSFNNCINF